MLRAVVAVEVPACVFVSFEMVVTSGITLTKPFRSARYAKRSSPFSWFTSSFIIGGERLFLLLKFLFVVNAD